jgi:hypothetical protein
VLEDSLKIASAPDGSSGAYRPSPHRSINPAPRSLAGISPSKSPKARSRASVAIASRCRPGSSNRLGTAHRCVILTLRDGTELYPMVDDDENDAGVLIARAADGREMHLSILDR